MLPGNAGLSLEERARERQIITLEKANEPEYHDQHDAVGAERNTVELASCLIGAAKSPMARLAVMTFSSRDGRPTMRSFRGVKPRPTIISSAGEIL